MPEAPTIQTEPVQPCRLVYVTWEDLSKRKQGRIVWGDEELLLDQFPSFDRVRALIHTAKEARHHRGRYRAISLDRLCEKADIRAVPAGDLRKLLELARAAGQALTDQGDDAGQDLLHLVGQLRRWADLPERVDIPETRQQRRARERRR